MTTVLLNVICSSSNNCNYVQVQTIPKLQCIVCKPDLVFSLEYITDLSLGSTSKRGRNINVLIVITRK